MPKNASAQLLCHCNHGGPPNDSFDLYSAMYKCLCGDGPAGPNKGFCGDPCVKTCTQQGTNLPGCDACAFQQCFVGAIGPCQLD